MNKAIQKKNIEEAEEYKNIYQVKRKDLLKHIHEFKASYPDNMKSIREEL